MVVYRQFKSGGFIFNAPYFDELLVGTAEGCLPKEPAAHALWHYYGIALKAWDNSNHQEIYEGDPDADFHAEAVFKGIAMAHGCNPDDMLQYWSAVEAQAMMLGSERTALPPKFKFNRRSLQ